MFSHIASARGRSLICAGLIVGATAFIASAATAGECPADKVKANATKPVTTPETGVADTVLASIDLANESIAAKGRTMRARRLTIAPGGVVSWHSHDDRPALIYVLEGEAVEYRNNCIDPIVHKAGEVARETRGTAHWWKNFGDKVVTLLAFDILHDARDKHM
jgi:quercetin dioxygenase-like cupin family protein